MKKARLFFKMVWISFHSSLGRHSAPLAGIAGQWLYYGAFFALIWVGVSHFGGIFSWSAYQVLFLSAMNLFSYAIAAMFCYQACVSLSEKIRGGTLDAALTKPVSPLLYEIYRGLNFGYMSHAALAVLVMVFASIQMRFAVSALSLILLGLMLIGATLVQAALLIAASGISFFFHPNNPFFSIVLIVREFTQYPISIYHGVVQALLTFVIPIGFVSFYPASAIFSVIAGSSMPRILPYFTPAVGIALLWLSVRLWNYASNRYQSTRK